jgi:prepilin-type N-terminal cleavage/methylation domain-containing protein
MKVNKKIIGFTLNELIIVIVVLGVLGVLGVFAVTAATRFIDV